MNEPVRKERFVRELITSELFRSQIILTVSAILSAVHAYNNFSQSFARASLWFGALGIYYLLLCQMRIILAYSMKHHRLRMMDEHSMRVYGMTGVLLVVLNGSLLVMLIMIINNRNAFTVRPYTLYIFLAYACFELGLAIYSLIQYYRKRDLLLLAARALSVSAALSSLFILMVSWVSKTEENTDRLWIIFTGLVISALIFLLAACMLYRARLMHKNALIAQNLEEMDIPLIPIEQTMQNVKSRMKNRASKNRKTGRDASENQSGKNEEQPASIQEPGAVQYGSDPENKEPSGS